jgi:hypothetical protein
MGTMADSRVACQMTLKHVSESGFNTNRIPAIGRYTYTLESAHLVQVVRASRIPTKLISHACHEIHSKARSKYEMTGP